MPNKDGRGSIGNQISQTGRYSNNDCRRQGRRFQQTDNWTCRRTVETQLEDKITELTKKIEQLESLLKK